MKGKVSFLTHRTICMSFLTLLHEVPKYGVFLGPYSHIQTEYVDLLRESPYSVRLRGNTDQKNFRIWTLFTKLVFLLQFENYSKDSEMTLHQQHSTDGLSSQICKLS